MASIDHNNIEFYKFNLLNNQYLLQPLFTLL